MIGCLRYFDGFVGTTTETSPPKFRCWSIASTESLLGELIDSTRAMHATQTATKSVLETLDVGQDILLLSCYTIPLPHMADATLSRTPTPPIATQSESYGQVQIFACPRHHKLRRIAFPFLYHHHFLGTTNEDYQAILAEEFLIPASYNRLMFYRTC